MATTKKKIARHKQELSRELAKSRETLTLPNLSRSALQILSSRNKLPNANLKKYPIAIILGATIAGGFILSRSVSKTRKKKKKTPPPSSTFSWMLNVTQPFVRIALTKLAKKQFGK